MRQEGSFRFKNFYFDYILIMYQFKEVFLLALMVLNDE